MKYDIIVVGSGPGGYVAAIRAAQLGRKVAVVERSEPGGVCLNWGCIPTKAMLKSAHIFEGITHAADYGIDASEAKPDMAKIVARSRSVADTMSRGVTFLLEKSGVDFIAGTAKLAGAGRVEVALADGGSATHEADHIILATGSRPREFEALPTDGVNILNYKQLLAYDRLPESIVVVGSGAIGCEFAYLFAALGSKVTLVEFMPTILPIEDEEVSKYMERSFRKLKAAVMTGAAVTSARVENGRCLLQVESVKGVQTLESEMVLSAIGVTANIDNLGLEEVGVAVERGKVTVDEFYRTNIAGVYAVGDIIPTPALAHVASAEAICCVEKICGLDPAPVDYGTIPSGVYTVPEVASVGLRERDAVAQGIEIRVGKFPFTASGKATAGGNRDGFVKLIFDKKDDRLLGAHMVGEGVVELIAEPVMAKMLGATASQIGRAVHPHPSMSEAVMEAAEAALGHCVHLL